MEINQNNMTYYQPKSKKYLTVGKALLMIFFSSLISVCIGAGGLLLLFHYRPDLIKDTVTNINKTEKEVTVTDLGIADAVDKVYDSVVIVKNYTRNELYSTGTGFVYKKANGKYYILTNYHVIEGGTSVGVQFTNGDEVKAVVENGDKYGDVAVLSYSTDKELAISELGSSKDMRVGDTVFAIGAPLDFSVYSWSVTRGILSGKDREVAVKVGNTATSDWIMQVLQTDAAINSGNSGGPLCNSNGEVIGITNMKLASSNIEGMGFAIPIEEASLYADAVINGEDVSRPYIGISMSNANIEMYARKYNLKTQDGVLIESVEAGSPSDKAGLKQADIIVAMDDVETKNVASLRYQLYKYKAGDTIKIKYIRDGKTLTTKLTLISVK